MEFIGLKLRVPRVKFSLRTLFTVVLVCCLFFAYTAWWMSKVRQVQAEAAAARAQAVAERLRAEEALARAQEQAAVLQKRMAAQAARTGGIAVPAETAAR